MIAVGIRYLTRRCVALNANKSEVEWPPHPGRVFMALAAAHFDSPQPSPEEREALLWLERQPAPTVAGPRVGGARAMVEGYVPANDVTGGIVSRARSAKRFLSQYVGDEPVVMRWPGEPAPGVRRALAGLCARVTRIGHSSSPVHIWLSDAAAGGEVWEPVGFAAEARTLRVPGSGTLAALGAAYAQGQRPQLSCWQRYARPAAEGGPAAVPGPFDSSVVVFTRECGTQLGLVSTLQLTGALRDVAMKLSESQPPPEWLSGHRPSGAPSEKPHCAFFPLPKVFGKFSDGHLLGVAMTVPSGLSEEDLRPVLGPLLFEPSGKDRELELWCSAWRWRVKRETSARPVWNLRGDHWTVPSRQWASVTPVVLHHHPKRNRDGDVERIVREAFRSALYPEPEAIRVGAVSPVPGALHARSMPAYEEGGARLCRYQTHVMARFAEPVRGPVLVGRGRYRGYGLFRPWPETGPGNGEQA